MYRKLNCLGILGVAVLLSFDSSSVSAGSQLVQRVLNVGIRPVFAKCSDLELSFGIMEESPIEIPKGITGIDGEQFVHKVLWVSQEKEKWAMSLNARNTSKAKANQGETVILKQNFEPYQVEIDFSDYFTLKRGDYYIYYEYRWGHRTNDDFEVVKEAVSPRYFFHLDQSGCIKFS